MIGLLVARARLAIAHWLLRLSSLVWTPTDEERETAGAGTWEPCPNNDPRWHPVGTPISVVGYGTRADLPEPGVMPVLMHVDPPYLSSTRHSLQYRHELATEAEHRELAEALRSTAASVVLSGYHSSLYDRLYADWERVEIAASTQQSGNDARRVEVLWMNYQRAEVLI